MAVNYRDNLNAEREYLSDVLFCGSNRRNTSRVADTHNTELYFVKMNQAFY